MGVFERYVSEGASYSSLSADGAVIAELAAQDGPAVTPGRVPVPLVTAQRLEGRTRITRSRLVGSIRVMRPRWRFNPRGPLGCLAGVRPWVSLTVPQADVTFGLQGTGR